MRQRVYAPSQHRADVLLIVSETTFNRLGAFFTCSLLIDYKGTEFWAGCPQNSKK